MASRTVEQSVAALVVALDFWSVVERDEMKDGSRVDLKVDQ